ncbi:hypothetical protein FACS1894186_5870 [Alphaproteobacteria bacterium]|nr:hypothetical protein FACS1894186_5870 [Alphaproteobacteria bacterium]
MPDSLLSSPPALTPRTTQNDMKGKEMATKEKKAPPKGAKKPVKKAAKKK